MNLWRTVFSKSALLLLVRVALGGMLFYAGFVKISNAAAFAGDIANYMLLPAVPNQFMAVVLPWWEIAAGLLLIFGLCLRPAALVALALFLTFGVAVSSALYRGLDIECGCFGTGSEPVGWRTLAIDLSGLAAALLVLWLARRKAVPNGDKPPENGITNYKLQITN